MPEPRSFQPGGLREYKKAQSRIAIEAAAVRLFLERGYAETSVEDIAEAVVISSRTFFRYFASKEDVLFAPLHEISPSFGDVLTQSLLEAAPEEALALAFQHVAAIYQQRRELILALFQVVQQTPSLLPGFLYRFTSVEPTLRDILTIHWGAQVPHSRIALISATSLTAFRVALQHWLATDAAEDFVALVDEHLGTLLGGTLLP